MLFWRAKSTKQAIESKSQENAEAASAGAEPEGGESAKREAAGQKAPNGAEPATDETVSTQSKIIPISSAARLSERLAEVNKAPSNPREAPAAKVETKRKGALIAADAGEAFLVQADAIQRLKDALGDAGPRAHVLIHGAPGTGRLQVAEDVARELARERSAGSDFIYAATGLDQEGSLQLFRVPAQAGDAIVRDVREALQKASAMLSRHVAGDGHQMSLAMLEEDHRQRSSGGIEDLKRRAEGQNIALVNTSEGFVLAPMHEGRVVRADVFRALPESLQRDVEAKITAFEGELHSLLEALPGTDIATDERHAALCQQTAERASKPSLALARKLTTEADGAGALIDAIEKQWLHRAAEYVRRGDAEARLEPPALSVISPAGQQAGGGAPVLIARAVSPVELFGEVGRDAAGAVVVRPGLFSLAAGGFLVIDAWRLANDRDGAAALSAALESGEVRPVVSAGVAIRAEAQPLSATIILIADRASLRKIKDTDPRIETHFAEVVSFAETATAFDLNESAFGQWAGALAKRANFRPLEVETAALLYDDARTRAGDMAHVSLDAAAVLAVLTLAERRAERAGRAHIGADDVRAAVAQRAVLRSVEVSP